uniref:Solute carrier family 26 member 10 n=1 Tax=Cyprinus carpio TaxID=7962 RepID=A0A8C1Y5X1_CYPCA
MSASVAVYRDIYTEDRFRQTYGTEDQSRGRERLRDRLAQRCSCSQVDCLHLLKKRLPVCSWLPKYKLKKWLLGDIIAGLTVGIVHIPQGMAFALLTSVAPVYGLYTSFFPVVLYMLFGTGHHVSTGTFAVLSLMTGSVVERLVPIPLALNSSSPELTSLLSDEMLDSDYRIMIACCLFLLSQLCMCGLQLGFLSTYLSEPIVKAFTSAAAFHVTVSQLQSMLGLRLPRYAGAFSLFKTLASVMENVPHTNLAELVISLLCLAVLVPVKEVNSRFRERLRTPIPVEIITVRITYAFSLDSKYDIQIVGHIPAGFPEPRLPALETVPEIAGDTVAITLVAYAVSVSLAMIYADKHRYSIDPNQELLAHGISNTVSSLFTCFPNSATLATTNILESAGAHTQLAGLFTSLVVLIVLLLIGPLFYFLPKAVLACINVTSLRQMFLLFQDLPDLWRISKIDFMVWLVTWLSVVVLNVDLGLAIGVVFSMMTVICRTQRANCSVLGRAANTEIYRSINNHNKVKLGLVLLEFKLINHCCICLNHICVA